MTMTTRADCEALDATDPLAPFRAEFALPPGVIYLDGNSLGALPRRTSERVRAMVEQEWGEALIRSYNEAGWWEKPLVLGDRLAPLLGAAPGQVVVCDSTSVNIFKVLTAALRMRPTRRAIVAEESSFPTDLYIAEGVAQQEYERRLIDAGTDPATAISSDVAVVLLNHVDYRTGRLRDMAGITKEAHRHGALIIWDLCHSAGALPISLDACEADFAVGCTYKYLNAGPGSPAYLYCADRHQDSVTQPLTGWWGHAKPFAFEPSYAPAPGVRHFLTGSQPMLAFAALESSLDIWQQVDLAALRKKSLSLTTLFMDLTEDLGLKLATPRDPGARGSQVALHHPNGYEIVQALIDRGVIGDFRAPDIMRFGFTPLYLSHTDVWDAAAVLRDILQTEAWRAPKYAVRHVVT